MNIKDIKNKHLNKMAFVCGAGPSLRFINPDILKEYVIFAANSAILKFPECDYFVTDDDGVCSWNYWRITAKNSRCKKLLYADKMRNKVSDLRPQEYLLFEHRQWATLQKDGSLLYHKENLKLTEDPEIPIIGARTSTATALHFAYIMGCDPIVLLGCDSCYEGKNRYYWQFPGEPKAIEYFGRFFSSPDQGLKKGKPVDKHCVGFDLYWQHFAEINPEVSKNRIIYVSDTGIVDVFPKMKIDEVLSQYSERKK
jgi:hypothetical protein